MSGGEIIDDTIYLVNDGTNVIGLYYNYMPFNFDIDPGGDIKQRLDLLEEKVGDGLVWKEQIN